MLGAAAPGVFPLLLQQPAVALSLASELERRGTVSPPTIDSRSLATDADAAVLKRRIRRVRHESLVRTTVRELFAMADVDRTAREWSRVATACTEIACAAALEEAQARNGGPCDEQGARVPFVVLGMGKLGGAELNLGSDIDVCFFYGTDDGRAGERSLHEHFARVATHTTDLLADTTEDGFAFRVDLRLRPEGSRGPVANSIASTERYYETWGRPWERAALVRAAPVAGNLALGRELLELLRPFVFRRGVDPTIARDMSAMLDRTRRELLRDDARDLKLGVGGIREAEFFVQALQLIWGGREPSLRVAGTLEALGRLRALALLSHREARAFGDAWALLRRVEHRVQSFTSFEVHLLPEPIGRQRALARSLGYPDFDSLDAALRRARALVHNLFLSAVPDRAESRSRDSTPPESAEALLADAVASGAAVDTIAALARSALGVRDADAAVDELLRLARRADLPLGVVTREQHPSLGPRLLAEVRDAPDPDLALRHLADLFSSMHGADRYARRLADAPAEARALVSLFGASETLSSTLLARPDLVDAIVSAGIDAPTVVAIPPRVRREIADARRAAHEVVPRGESRDFDDVDVCMGALRRVQREIGLEVGLADLSGSLSAGEVARRLTALAEASIVEAFEFAGEEMAARFGLRPGATGALDGIAVFAMGSVAACELGYGGDLDWIVLFERDDETQGGTRPGVQCAEFVARLTQRAIVVLSSAHAEGPGYAVDTRLRPSGAQGTLVVSIDAFERYHSPRVGESASADAWERQALIRSRFVAGDAAFARRGAQSIERFAYESGGQDVDRIRRLREKIETELGQEPAGVHSLKYGRGGVVDIEFAAQALQMRHGADASIRTPTTRRAIAALRDAGYADVVRANEMLAAERLIRRAILATRLVAQRNVLVAGTPATTTVARKLGYRDGAHGTAEDSLLDDLARARDHARRAFDETLHDLAAERTDGPSS